MKKAKYRDVLNLIIFGSATTSIVLNLMESPIYFISKPLTTILVILLAFFSGETGFLFKRLVVIGLCFCLLGDILLINESFFLYGLVAFLVAHLLFAKGFIQLKGFQKKPFVALTLTSIGIGLYFWLYPDLGNLKYPVAAYILIILFMAWQGIGLFVQTRTKPYGLIALGVVLFMFSDSMIAVNKFKTEFRWSAAIILSTYWFAITLIANSTYFIKKF